VLREIGAPLDVTELKIPPLRRGQVLVDVAYAGVCHSQLNEMLGLRGPDRFLPHALGHEGSGVVLDIGPEVTKVAPGDHVVITWIKGLGLEGGPTVYVDESGRGVNSGSVSCFARESIVSENRLVAIPPDFPLREAALLGCAVPTGCGIIINTAYSVEDKKLCVFGVGGIGQCSIVAASISNAKQIVAVDVSQERLTFASHLGATHIIANGGCDVRSLLMEVSTGDGFDVAIDASGNVTAMETAFEVTKRGGLCVIAGNSPHQKRMTIDPMELIRGKRIVGSVGGECFADRDIPSFAEWFRLGRLPLSKMVSHQFSLEEVNDAFSVLASGRARRCVIDMNG
jgi:S-(hydroxymethyl)glutathione dehydrogenase/alcohol dehydrogenase